MTASLLPTALTMGEPGGISGEITLKTWLYHRHELAPFCVIDDIDRLKRLAKQLAWSVKPEAIASPEDTAAAYLKGVPVLQIDEPIIGDVGHLDPANGPGVRRSIDQAVEFVASGRCGALVTNPIHKENLYKTGFKFPGHTEYLGHLAGDKFTPIMMLVSDRLRVVTVTRHVGLRQAIEELTTELIVETAEVTVESLKMDFGIPEPRLAVSGLNPHAGEGGHMGREEIEIITPAIEALKAGGHNVIGPLPGDTMFHATARERYDVALCMYHDQALIPIKTLDFDSAVNVTLGLPFIRTSPDHGTALEIAGTGMASETSLVASLRLAGHMALARQSRE
ncbi:MAG: 4-hydroxythreonine-4-phosphate dehydrogenase PdxA [Rhodospirillaceae bacterium]|jgi:4-hydroxythreonine-4-phosphate dehydrogenase